MLVDRTFNFAEVVSALARVHSLPTSAERTLRARLQHFQRIGLTVRSPGKGRKIEYKLEDILWWAFALELSQFGVEPVFTKKLLDIKPRPIIWITVPMNPTYFFHPVFMGRYVKEDESLSEGPEGSIRVFHFVGKSIDDVERFAEAMGIAASEFKRRYGTVDLLGLYDRVVTELKKIP